ncbi:type II toxin-antitoxin system VapC family toxin [Aureimonas psammosilenae]|uniref:type II toxin-antitoxin system VapC family toxin n=1 Tax=Aureimonas psammosilenae TaxID=2495496 RepID=UPI001260A1AF|nr:type II toxin-antitoxin system VapC family toxin [Aureimonas psammosilenae]
MSSGVVLDTSALLAFLLQEPGGEDVGAMLQGRALVSAVNVQELLAKLITKGMSPHHARETVRSLDLECHAHTLEAAEAAAELIAQTRAKGLSLGDRSCLALARKMNMPAITADRIWAELADAAGVAVTVIR